jgi:hypothetical protein
MEWLVYSITSAGLHESVTLWPIINESVTIFSLRSTSLELLEYIFFEERVTQIVLLPKFIIKINKAFLLLK